MSKQEKIPTKWSVPKVWSVPDKYTVPFPYSIPTDYTVPDIFEETTPPTTQTTTTTVQTASEQTAEKQKPEKRFQIDPLTASLITAGMVGLFGGVAIGRISKKKKGVENKNGS